MLRIGQFTDTFLPVVDGVGRVALAYSETLCKMGHQVSVVAATFEKEYRGGYPFELVFEQGGARSQAKLPLPARRADVRIEL